MATPAKLKKVLSTGAGTGFGYEVAMRLAEKGFDVVAAVEVYGQMQTLKRQASERGVSPGRTARARRSSIGEKRTPLTPGWPSASP